MRLSAFICRFVLGLAKVRQPTPRAVCRLRICTNDFWYPFSHLLCSYYACSYAVMRALLAEFGKRTLNRMRHETTFCIMLPFYGS